jgi:hypothetical protein
MSAEPLTCNVCRTRGRRYRRGLCGACALQVDLRTVLDDGTGQIRPELLPFFDGVRAMTNPIAGISWVRRPHVHQMLRTLADPATPLTHETLNAMSPWRSVAYLRDLLMLHGVLPPADRHLMLFQRWLRDTLAEITEPQHRQLIARFTTWHVLHRLRRFAERGPVTEKQTQQARAEVRQAVAFLAWLDQRDRTLSTCGQGDIDAWYAGAYTARRLTHAFLRWAIRNGLLARLMLPHQATAKPAPISQQQRLTTLRRLLNDEQIPLLTRVAAIMVLLYAQPLTRVLRLTVDDVFQHDGHVSLRLGDPPTPVPEPFADLLLSHLDQRLNLTTATNQHSRLLFPGRRGGQPMATDTIEKRLRAHHIPVLNGRTAALRHLVLQAPAPVIARMLGYTDQQTSRTATAAGSPWSRYAPGDDHSP